MNLLKVLFFFLLLMTTHPSATQSIDSSTTELNEEKIEALNNTDNDDNFMAFLLVLGAIFVFGCIGAGIVITAFVVLTTALLISLGILSIAVITALRSKSLTQGFKTLFVSLTSFAGLISGIAFFVLLNGISRTWDLTTSLLLGGISGIVGGFLLGIISFYTLQKISAFLIKKFTA